MLALLLMFGHQLESLPPALNALVFTGVLVPIMGNLVMPFERASELGRLVVHIARAVEGLPHIAWAYRSR